MKNLLDDPITLLMELERELHDKSESGLAHDVREVIVSLEAIQQLDISDTSKTNKMIYVIGEFIARLPHIMALIDRWKE